MFTINGISFTKDQLRLIYLIEQIGHLKGEKYSFLNEKMFGKLWVKELSILILAYHLTVEGIFETYDYAPTPIQFFGRTSYTVNLTFEGIDDIEDLRELSILEKIRLSTTQYGFITGYRLTEKGTKILQDMPQDIKQEIDQHFYCEHCKTRLDFLCEMGSELIVKLKCPSCSKTEVDIEFAITEDVSYVSRPYFLEIMKNLVVRNGSGE
ncbi:MAG: hypothetical protein ACTSYD_00115 [Candidatus Heimdallarchaeaceae archaeon]